MDSGLKFEVQTEGLGEFWGITPVRHERIAREPMTAGEIEEIVLSILAENDTESSGLIILKRGHRALQIDLESGSISMSDPQNVNYQNISISRDDLSSSILSYFNLLEERHEERKSATGASQWMVAIAAGSISFATFYYSFQHLTRDFHFMPKPEFVEVEDDRDYREHLKAMSGVYITEWEDGETLLNLKGDGTWEFYDIERARNPKFSLNEVEQGDCRPVYQKGRLALLTRNYYVFKWESEGVLSFQERRYIRTAVTENEVPFVTFPN